MCFKRKVMFAGLVLILMSFSVRGKEPVFPDTILAGPMDSNVPSPASVLGYRPGERMTEHYEMERYLDQLVAASSRVRRITYGESYEHRAMHLLIISAPENLTRLDAIREAIQALTDPRRTDAARAKAIAAETPIVVWFNYANDGDESAAFEAAMETAYLLAASRDPRVETWLKHAVILLNMTHNPDSHQRFVSWYKAAVVGPHGTADPQADEHMGDWRMKSNYNHYLFDLNRDALALTQQESQLVAAQFHTWHPQVFIDHHGETTNMFYPPYAEPVNPYVPESIKTWARRFGQAMGAAFGKRGWSFYTEEIFDLFYGGYWDSYPALNGAVGMTFETDGGGRKGYRWRREDGTIITQRDAVLHHMTASLNTLDTAVNHRKAILLDYYRFFETALTLGREKGIRAFLIPAGHASARVRRFIRTLLRHHLEVYRLTRPVTLNVRSWLSDEKNEVTFQAGSWVIPAAQPQARLLFGLFDRDPELSASFLRQVEEAHAFNHRKGEKVRPMPYGFYDLTAWSLPLLFQVETWVLPKGTVPEGTRVVTVPEGRGRVVEGPADFGVAFALTGDEGRHFLAHLLKDGWRVAVVPKSFRQGDRHFPAGTVIVRWERQKRAAWQKPATGLKALEPLVKHTGVTLYPLQWAYTEAGPDLGSEWIRVLKRPRVAVVTGPPVGRTAYGWIWYLFERELHYPFTALRAETLRWVDLRKYQVLVVPDGGSELGERLGKSGLKRLDAWVRAGGTLILIGNSTDLARSKEVGWTTVKPYDEVETEKEKEVPDPELHPLPGVLLRANLESRSWLTLGYEENQIPVLMTVNRLWEPSETGTNIVTFAVRPRIGGYIFDDLKSVIPGKVYCVDEPVGRGHVVLFADDPGYRLFTWGTIPLLINAVFLGGSV